MTNVFNVGGFYRVSPTNDATITTVVLVRVLVHNNNSSHTRHLQNMWNSDRSLFSTAAVVTNVLVFICI